MDSSHYLVYNNSNRNSNSNYNYTIPPSYLLRRDPPLLPILVLCYVTLLLKSFGPQMLTIGREGAPTDTIAD